MAEKGPARIQLHAVKYSPPPADLPVYGSVPPGQITVMGRSTHVAALDEQRYVYGILEEDRSSGVHVLGRAGIGKTKLLESMARQDIAAKRKIAVIDATGDLVKSLVPLLDEEAKAKTSLIGVGEQSSISLLPRKGDEVRFADTLALATAEYTGDSFNPLLRKALAAVLTSRPFATVADLAHALQDAPAMQDVRALLEDLLANPTSKAAISGNQPITGNVFAVLSSAELGFSRARALSHLVSDAILWARERDNMSLPLYVDGLELLGGRGGVAMLRDMHAANIAPVLSHRAYADVSPALLSAISSTIGTEVAFRLSGEDGSRARNEFAQTFDVRDFLVLATRQCYVRLQIRGELREPFSAETLPLVAAQANGSAPKP